MNKHSALYAAGAILLGIVTIYFGDFAMQWQPVPKGIGMHQPLVWLSGALLVIGGAAILSRKWERAGALLLTVFYGFWVVALHLPIAFASAGHIGAWNGPAESLLMTSGGLALLSASAGPMRINMALTARLLAGVCALVFGLAHFNYIDFTAGMVPAWIPPAQVFWAWATGAGHFAAGVALVSGIQARLAATVLAGMMASFVVLLHIPRVIANPGQHIEWIMLAVSSSLTGSVWLVRKYAT
jgi:uncharacterized membrane protein YphA (DoxX/SURF4 family)